MAKLSINKMINGEENNYSLVVAVAKRAREITEDYITHGEVAEDKPISIATKEFKNNKYSINEPDGIN